MMDPDGDGATTVTDKRTPSSQPRFYKRGKGVFMLEIAAIKADLATGSKNYVYQKWRDRLGVSYAQFTRYVKAHIENAAPAAPKPSPAVPFAPAHAGLSAMALSSRPEPRQAPQEPSRRFHFDPMDVDRKDLI